jgi:hypothetical protein
MCGGAATFLLFPGAARVEAQRLVPIAISAEVTDAGSEGSGAQGSARPVVVEVYLDGDVALTGLGMRLYFDTAALTWVGLEDVLRRSFVGQQLRPDLVDGDGDPATDTYLTIGWMDSGENWPGDDSARHRLLRANFVRTGESETFLRLTGSAVPPGRSAEPTAIRVAP